MAVIMLSAHVKNPAKQNLRKGPYHTTGLCFSQSESSAFIKTRYTSQTTIRKME